MQQVHEIKVADSVKDELVHQLVYLGSVLKEDIRLYKTCDLSANVNM